MGDMVAAEEQHARDYIHQANLQMETALRTFQSQVWEEMQRYFSPLERGWQDKGLNDDQERHFRTLERIRNSLRELGVPPRSEEPGSEENTDA